MPDSSIVVMGGYDHTWKNDTWRSTDNGATWTEVTANAQWTARDGLTSVAMPDGSIVVMGGRDDNFTSKNDVWRSTDKGATWTQVNASAGWSGRFGFTSVATPDGSIVLMGGFADNVTNDVWRLITIGSSEQDPAHTYNQLGFYTVTLTARNSEGASTLAKPGYIKTFMIIGGDKGYYLVHSNVDGASVYFNNDRLMGETANGTLLVDVCTTCAPVRSFTVKKCGYYPLTQNITDHPSKNEVVDLYANLTRPKEPLIADFTSNTTAGLSPLAVGFTDLSIGGPNTWNWSFGDGTYSDDEDPAHEYTTPGTYNVSLHVTNSACFNSTIVKSDYVYVLPAPQTTLLADFSISPLTGTAPLTVRCTDKSIGNPIWFVYDFGDGSIGTGPNPVHTYAKQGSFSVSLTVKNIQEGGTVISNTTTKKNYVTVTKSSGCNVLADFSASPVTGKAPLKVQFTDQSTGKPNYRTWDFGDKRVSLIKNPVHTYKLPGIYSVKLTVWKTGAGFRPEGNTMVRSRLITVT
jgi:PKD repeat protein